MTTTPEQRLAAAERELAYRRRCYPRWTENGKLSQGTADYQIAVMADIVEVLRALAQPHQQALFPG